MASNNSARDWKSCLHRSRPSTPNKSRSQKAPDLCQISPHNDPEHRISQHVEHRELQLPFLAPRF
jgi:hypothetical protein